MPNVSNYSFLTKIVLLVVAVLFSLPTVMQAQESKSSIGDIPVNYYTGISQISIPLITLKAGNIALPISLNYSTFGNRVDDLPGIVGLGWGLEAGGMINRNVQGLPDEAGNYYLNTTLDFMCTYTAMGHLKIDGTEPPPVESYDLSPDEFNYSLLGRSGQFFFDSTGTSCFSPLEPKKATLNTLGMTITGEDGAKYEFLLKETTTSDTNLYTNGWYLTKIKSPSGIDSVVLNYTDVIDVNQQWNTKRSIKQTEGICSYCALNSVKDTLTNTIHKRYLTSIQMGASIVTFCYSFQAGSSGEKKLDTVIISSNGIETKRFILNYTTVSNRLMLSKIVEIAPDGKTLPPYKFTYDNTVLPARLTGGADHWGFANGKTNRDPDFNYGKAQILNRIDYPTGGYTSFTYEGNDCGYIADVTLPDSNKVRSVGGLRVKKIESSNGIDQTKSLIREFQYKTTADLTRSSGSLVSDTGHVFIYNPYENELVCLSGYGLTQGSPVGYSQVDEVLDGGGKGYTHYEFKSPISDPDEYAYYGESNYYRFSKDFLRGFPTKVITKNSNSNIVQELSKKYTKYEYKKNIHTINVEVVITQIFPHCSIGNTTRNTVGGVTVNGITYFHYTDYISTNDTTIKYEYYITYWDYIPQNYYIKQMGYVLSSDTVKIYDANGQNPVTSIKDYTYRSSMNGYY